MDGVATDVEHMQDVPLRVSAMRIADTEPPEVVAPNGAGSPPVVDFPVKIGGVNRRAALPTLVPNQWKPTDSSNGSVSASSSRDSPQGRIPAEYDPFVAPVPRPPFGISSIEKPFPERSFLPLPPGCRSVLCTTCDYVGSERDDTASEEVASERVANEGGRQEKGVCVQSNCQIANLIMECFHTVDTKLDEVLQNARIYHGEARSLAVFSDCAEDGRSSMMVSKSRSTTLDFTDGKWPNDGRSFKSRTTTLDFVDEKCRREDEGRLSAVESEGIQHETSGNADKPRDSAVHSSRDSAVCSSMRTWTVSRDSCGRDTSEVRRDTTQGTAEMQDVVAALMKRTTLSKKDQKVDNWLARLVCNPYFDSCIVSVVLFNALLVGAQVNHNAGSEEDFPPFVIAEYFCTGVFSLELCLRFAAMRGSLCRSKDRVWTIFDTVLVATSWIDIIMTEVMENVHLPSAGASISKIIKVARAARVMRVVRMVRFLTKIRIMVTMILGSMTALFWLFVLIVSVVYIFAIVLTQGATELRRSARGQSMDEDVKEFTFRYFGSILRTMYGLFLSMTSGVGWGDLAAVTMDMGPLYFFFFLFFVFFTFFSVLNIVTGVFVDGAIQQAQGDRCLRAKRETEAKKAYAEDLCELLQHLDGDGNGYISYQEWLNETANPEVKMLFSGLGISSTDAVILFNVLDIDGDRSVSIPELVEGIQRVKGPAQSLQMQMVVARMNKLIEQNKHLSLQISCCSQGQYGGGLSGGDMRQTGKAREFAG
eukprot:TRINITY_DN22683_c0_g1_i2.p1 TRINITY_DN22683_c0_g1~~TRINITY_DN22683_c0_g1_i2.p1  ORF type:complete len:762 (+),score=144.00 TRINITY_DN22683_c0_g1_i2:154-2439(+)